MADAKTLGGGADGQQSHDITSCPAGRTGQSNRSVSQRHEPAGTGARVSADSVPGSMRSIGRLRVRYHAICEGTAHRDAAAHGGDRRRPCAAGPLSGQLPRRARDDVRSTRVPRARTNLRVGSALDIRDRRVRPRPRGAARRFGVRHPPGLLASRAAGRRVSGCLRLRPCSSDRIRDPRRLARCCCGTGFHQSAAAAVVPPLPPLRPDLRLQALGFGVQAQLRTSRCFLTAPPPTTASVPGEWALSRNSVTCDCADSP